MGKYYGNGGKKVGKVGNEKYYINRGENIVQTNNKYYPVNSTLLKKKEFKEYVLSLLEEGVPQIYIVEELPEEVYTYALIFVQNEEGTDIYVDKDGLRTYINIEGGEGEGDAVDIVDNVPQVPKNNTIYFVNNNANKEKKIDKKQLKDTPLECDIYVCDNNVLRKIDVDYTEVLNQAKAYTDEKILSASGAEIVTSLPAEMVENKLYFNTRSSSLSQDFFYVYTKQNGQLYYLGEMQHHPARKVYLFLKRVYITSSTGAPKFYIAWYTPDPFEPTFKELWNHLSSVGSISEDSGYPASGYMGSMTVTCVYRAGNESNMSLSFILKYGSNMSIKRIPNDSTTTFTGTVTQIL